MIGAMTIERGMIGRLPYLGMGSGTPLRFIRGLAPEAGVDAAGTQRMGASLQKPFAARRRVMAVNRWKGLPRGMSMAELAEEHADAIRSLGVSGRSTSRAYRPAAASPSSWPPTTLTSSIASCCSALPAGSGPRGERCSAARPPASGAAPHGRRSPCRWRDSSRPGEDSSPPGRSRGSPARACSPGETIWPTWPRRSRRRKSRRRRLEPGPQAPPRDVVG